MPWTWADTLARAPVSNTALLRKFIHAWNQRRAVMGLSDHEWWPAQRDYIQVFNRWIYEAMVWIETYCPQFVVSHGEGGGCLGEDYYDGRETIDMWVFADLLTSAGYSGADFPAKLRDLTVTTGKHDTGHRWRVPLFNSIRQCKNRLVWTLDGVTATTHKRQATGYSATSAEEAKADAESQWAGSSEVSHTATRVGAWSEITKYSDGTFEANLIRLRGTFSIWTATPPCSRQIKWLYKTGKIQSNAGDEYDVQGDSPLAEDVYKNQRTDEPTTATDISFVIGNTDNAPTNWPATPSDPGTNSKGYIESAATALFQWNVAGGFDERLESL